MAYLEELLPEFRKGAKIRQNDWPDGVYIFVRNGEILPSHPSLDVKDDNDLISNKWEFYQEPIDWEYIIDHKCLCWFWDDVDNLEESSYGYLIRHNKYTKCFYDGKEWYNHCRPVRKDELNLYEERNDE